MCFRPPEAGAGEKVCPGCYLVIAPNADGTCPECGAQMVPPSEAASGAPKAGDVAGAPAAPSAPGAPQAPRGPE